MSKNDGEDQRERQYRDVNQFQNYHQGHRNVFKNTITPKIARRVGNRIEEEQTPPIQFDRGEMHLSFLKGMEESIITRKALQESGMSIMDNSMFKPAKSRKKLQPMTNKDSTLEIDSMLMKSYNDKER